MPARPLLSEVVVGQQHPVGEVERLSAVQLKRLELVEHVGCGIAQLGEWPWLGLFFVTAEGELQELFNLNLLLLFLLLFLLLLLLRVKVLLGLNMVYNCEQGEKISFFFFYQKKKAGKQNKTKLY